MVYGTSREKGAACSVEHIEKRARSAVLEEMTGWRGWTGRAAALSGVAGVAGSHDHPRGSSVSSVVAVTAFWPVACPPRRGSHASSAPSREACAHYVYINYYRSSVELLLPSA